VSSPRATVARAPRPWNLVAELTYRCPLRCVYCSNPLGFRDVKDRLDTETWVRVFREAAGLGVVHVGLTGGEPTLRSDLPEIVSGAAEAGLYTHLVTAGLPIPPQDLTGLVSAGLRSVQLSFQDSRAAGSEEIAGVAVFERKLAFAAAVRSAGLPLSLNVVLHRRNLARVSEFVELARELGAHRLELANTQYYGWALANRRALLPTAAQVEEAAEAVRRARQQPGAPEIVFVLPDYHAERPKPCMGGWGRRIAVVNPQGLVLPCHAAAELEGLEFYSVVEHPLSECWADAPGMNAYRGEDWMQEPCRSCPERERDFGGCRCQAALLAGDATVADPVCALSPHHGVVMAERAAAGVTEPMLRYRGEGPARQGQPSPPGD
jgi:pyrroloquinoline quinone biosynthesis protein E